MTTPDVDTLVTDHMPLARRLAASFTRRCELPLYGDDFESAATEGLWQTAKWYAAGRCVAFRRNAIRRMRHRMISVRRRLFGRNERIFSRDVDLPERAYCEGTPAFVESEAFDRRVQPLQARQQAIVRAIYGDGLTQAEVAREHQLTPVFVSYTHKRALARLRCHSAGC